MTPQPALVWTRTPPDREGWWWCQYQGDKPGELWEAVVRIDMTEEGLRCSWMTMPGQADTMLAHYWDGDALWAGPIEPPKEP